MKENPLTSLPAKLAPGKSQSTPEKRIMNGALVEAEKQGLDPANIPVRSRNEKQAERSRKWGKLLRKHLELVDPPWGEYKQDAIMHALFHAGLQGVKPGEERWVRFISEGWQNVHDKTRRLDEDPYSSAYPARLAAQAGEAATKPLELEVQEVGENARLIEASHERPGETLSYRTLVAVDESEDHVYQLEIFKDNLSFDVRMLEWDKYDKNNDIEDVTEELIDHYRTNLTGFE